MMAVVDKTEVTLTFESPNTREAYQKVLCSVAGELLGHRMRLRRAWTLMLIEQNQDAQWTRLQPANAVS